TCNSTTCQNIPIVCGNNLVQPGEQCDKGPTGDATCTPGCTLITACTQCEVAGTPCPGTKVTAFSPFGCAGLFGVALTNCLNVLNCLQTNPTCPRSPPGTPPTIDDPTACFCGSMDLGTCAGASVATLTSASGGVCATAYLTAEGGLTTAARD